MAENYVTIDLGKLSEYYELFEKHSQQIFENVGKNNLMNDKNIKNLLETVGYKQNSSDGIIRDINENEELVNEKLVNENFYYYQGNVFKITGKNGDVAVTLNEPTKEALQYFTGKGLQVVFLDFENETKTNIEENKEIADAYFLNQYCYTNATRVKEQNSCIKALKKNKGCKNFNEVLTNLARQNYNKEKGEYKDIIKDEEVKKIIKRNENKIKGINNNDNNQDQQLDNKNNNNQNNDNKQQQEQEEEIEIETIEGLSDYYKKFKKTVGNTNTEDLKNLLKDNTENKTEENEIENKENDIKTKNEAIETQLENLSEINFEGEGNIEEGFYKKDSYIIYVKDNNLYTINNEINPELKFAKDCKTKGIDNFNNIKIDEKEGFISKDNIFNEEEQDKKNLANIYLLAEYAENNNVKNSEDILKDLKEKIKEKNKEQSREEEINKLQQELEKEIIGKALGEYCDKRGKNDNQNLIENFSIDVDVNNDDNIKNIKKILKINEIGLIQLNKNIREFLDNKENAYYINDNIKDMVLNDIEEILEGLNVENLKEKKERIEKIFEEVQGFVEALRKNFEKGFIDENYKNNIFKNINNNSIDKLRKASETLEKSYKKSLSIEENLKELQEELEKFGKDKKNYLHLSEEGDYCYFNNQSFEKLMKEIKNNLEKHNIDNKIAEKLETEFKNLKEFCKESKKTVASLNKLLNTIFNDDENKNEKQKILEEIQKKNTVEDVKNYRKEVKNKLKDKVGNKIKEFTNSYEAKMYYNEEEIKKIKGETKKNNKEIKLKELIKLYKKINKRQEKTNNLNELAHGYVNEDKNKIKEVENKAILEDTNKFAKIPTYLVRKASKGKEGRDVKKLEDGFFKNCQNLKKLIEELEKEENKNQKLLEECKTDLSNNIIVLEDSIERRVKLYKTANIWETRKETHFEKEREMLKFIKEVKNSGILVPNKYKGIVDNIINNDLTGFDELESKEQKRDVLVMALANLLKNCINKKKEEETLLGKLSRDDWTIDSLEDETLKNLLKNEEYLKLILSEYKEVKNKDKVAKDILYKIYIYTEGFIDLNKDENKDLVENANKSIEEHQTKITDGLRKKGNYIKVKGQVKDCLSDVIKGTYYPEGQESGHDIKIKSKNISLALACAKKLNSPIGILFVGDSELSIEVERKVGHKTITVKNKGNISDVIEDLITQLAETRKPEENFKNITGCESVNELVEKLKESGLILTGYELFDGDKKQELQHCLEGNKGSIKNLKTERDNKEEEEKAKKKNEEYLEEKKVIRNKNILNSLSKLKTGEGTMIKGCNVEGIIEGQSKCIEVGGRGSH